MDDRCRNGPMGGSPADVALVDQVGSMCKSLQIAEVLMAGVYRLVGCDVLGRTEVG